MEHRRICNVCGKIYCYTDLDLKENETNSAMSALSAIGTIATVLSGGNSLNAYASDYRSERYADKIVNYFKCPACNSVSTRELTNDEWLALQNGKHTQNIHLVENEKRRKVDINSNATEDSLLRRTQLFLEEGDWDSASAYAEQILDINPECAMAYVYKLMSELKVRKQDVLGLLDSCFDNNKEYLRAIRFADEPLKKVLQGYNDSIRERNNYVEYKKFVQDFNRAQTESEYLELEDRFRSLGEYRDSVQFSKDCKDKRHALKYTRALKMKALSKSEEDFVATKNMLLELGNYSDARKLAVECNNKAEEMRKEKIYSAALEELVSNDINTLRCAVSDFEEISDWKDALQKKAEAEDKISKIEKKKVKSFWRFGNS